MVFCGVHFMAESADILTGDHQQVILPDLNAGCSMADMADIDSVEEAWDDPGRVTDIDRVVPVTYMNSSASLKAFVGATAAWSAPRPTPGRCCAGPSTADGSGRSRGDQVLFFPDQHLGRNTGFELGYGADDMAVWNPRLDPGGLDDATLKSATLLLWKGHCSVHQRFCPAHIDAFRAEHPDGIVVVHPECAHEVVEAADLAGSTDYIIRAVADAPPVRSSAWAPRSIWSSGSTTRPRTRRWCRSTRWSAPAPPCSASTPPTWPGSSRAWWPARSATGSGSTTRPPHWARVALERMLATV